MRTLFPAILAGLLFGAGLTVSDMVNPLRVLAFLDLFGDWDATLAFVMGSAILPSAAAYRVAARLRRPLVADAFHVPRNRDVDSRLAGGAILFGIGWGLVGLCPGPAVAGLAFGLWQSWLFAAAMVGGMLLHRVAVR